LPGHPQVKDSIVTAFSSNGVLIVLDSVFDRARVARKPSPFSSFIPDLRVRRLLEIGERYLEENAERIMACRVIAPSEP